MFPSKPSSGRTRRLGKTLKVIRQATASGGHGVEIVLGCRFELDLELNSASLVGRVKVELGLGLRFELDLDLSSASLEVELGLGLRFEVDFDLNSGRLRNPS